MKNKIKKWHIFLMSFITLLVTICASIFSLKADPVDDETGEILMDNWNLDIVFYDSTVNNGVTPLTSIDWDASNGSYERGTPRIITVQINYDNDSAVTTYQPGELEIVIPNLAYRTEGNDSAYWSTKITVGANDPTHTNYDWTFLDGTISPSTQQELYKFYNTNTIEEKANFEGSIQIVYEITPEDEYYILSPNSKSNDMYKQIQDLREKDFIKHEMFEDQCVHDYSKTIQAVLGRAGQNIIYENKFSNTEHTITSPNWPENYPTNVYVFNNYWEYTSPTSENLSLYFDSSCILEEDRDYVYIYDKNGTTLYSLTGTQMAGKIFEVEGNYVKVAMYSDSYRTFKGFSLSIGNGEIIRENTYPENSIVSNDLEFNYTRTYIHPWKALGNPVEKLASKITSYDGLGENPTDYTWVKYTFKIYHSYWSNDYNNYINTDFVNTYSYFNEVYYPYNKILKETVRLDDVLLEGCVAYYNGQQLEADENNKISLDLNSFTRLSNDGYYYTTVYIGYPKSIYNEENNNTNITNTITLYGKYLKATEESYLSEDSISLNLENYDFSYSGNLYGMYKNESHFGNNDYFYYQNLVAHNEPYCFSSWMLAPVVKYTGDPLTVRIGDDLLFATNKDGESVRVTDEEYYFSSVKLNQLYNANEQAISITKYPVKLFVRYKGATEYVQYGDALTSFSEITFTKEQGVVGFYIQIENMREGLHGVNNTSGSSITKASYLTCKTVYLPKDTENLPESGTLHNFSFINVFKTDASGNLILVNEPSLDSYNTELTKRNIATYDMNAYGHYMQRAFSSVYWSYAKLGSSIYSGSSKKEISTITQDAGNEVFKGYFTLYGGVYGSPQLTNGNISYMPSEEFFKQANEKELYIKYIKLEDTLPLGLEITSSEKEILESIYFTGTRYYGNTTIDYKDILGLDGQQLFESNEELKKYLIDNTEIIITPNFEGSNQTKLEVIINTENNPFVIVDDGDYLGRAIYINCQFDWSLSYDNYLEYGKTIKNTVYTKTNLTTSSSGTSGNITSVISTHQDVTTFVQTDKNNFTTGTADSSLDSKYVYKLRARTGVADVTNLILYTNIETAQPERDRWQGKFIEIDTSYAENKGYNVKPYYSESPAAGNLYNEDGTLNSDWEEYIPASYTNGLRITFNENCKTASSYEYFYIYYYYNNTLYRAGKYYGNSIAGKVIDIPSTDFYLYWVTSSVSTSSYGFSIDSIENITTNTTIGSSGYSLPNYTPIELKGENYPESEHNPYTSYLTQVWHYTGDPTLIDIGTPKEKVKSLAFEYLDANNNPAIVPLNSITYVLIEMKSPNNEKETRLARMDCRTQWNAIDEFGHPVDFITGINSNVVKVALPNSVKEDSSPSISLRFTKEINGTDSEFENMKLDKAAQQTFLIRLTNLTENDDGTYNQVTALLKSNQELIISQIPVGTYLLEELGDNYFDFVDFTDNNDPEIVINGVTFERTDQGYIITVSEELTENIEFNIKVTNEIEPERFYEDKNSQENLFLKNKIEENE